MRRATLLLLAAALFACHRPESPVAPSGDKPDIILVTIDTLRADSVAFVGAYPLDSRYGLNQGFDTYDDNYGKGAATIDFAVQERPASAVLDAAAKWWSGNAGKKRFLWIHLYDPHAPYRPPEPFATQYAADPYLGEIAAVDDALSKQLAPLLASNPLLIVTADHGEGRGDHGELTHGL